MSGTSSSPRLVSDHAASTEIEEIDRSIVELLARRGVLAATLPADTGPRSVFPLAFRTEDVVDRYRAALGVPGELVARAVLNLSRAARRLHS